MAKSLLSSATRRRTDMDLDQIWQYGKSRQWDRELDQCIICWQVWVVCQCYILEMWNIRLRDSA